MTHFQPVTILMMLKQYKLIHYISGSAYHQSLVILDYMLFHCEGGLSLAVIRW